MTADELIAYIRGVISTTSPQTDNASVHRAVASIREALNKYPSDKNCSDAMDRYMRKAIPNDMQKAAPHIPSIIPYTNYPPPAIPLTPSTTPNYPLTEPFWMGTGINKLESTHDLHL